MRQRLAEQEFKQLLKDKTNNIEILLREQLPQNPSLLFVKKSFDRF